MSLSSLKTLRDSFKFLLVKSAFTSQLPTLFMPTNVGCNTVGYVFSYTKERTVQALVFQLTGVLSLSLGHTMSTSEFHSNLPVFNLLIF